MSRRIAPALWFALVILSSMCGCKQKESVTSSEITNRPPSVPAVAAPVDHANNVENDPKFAWHCDDPDGDSLTYKVVLWVNEPDDKWTYVESSRDTLFQHRFLFRYDSTYWWRVIADDGHGNQTAGPIATFHTRMPERLALVGKCDLPARSDHMLLDGHYAYVIPPAWGYGNTVHIVDVSDPSNPSEVSRLGLPDGGTCVIKSGFLYAVGYDKILVADVNDPTDPKIVFTPDSVITRQYVDAIVLDTLLLVTFNRDSYVHLPGIDIYDISDPTKPKWVEQLLDTMPHWNSGARIVTSGDFAYLWSGQSLRTLRVSDPRHFEFTDTLQVDGADLPCETKVSVNGSTICISGFLKYDSSSGLLVRRLATISLADPAHPRLEGWYDRVPSTCVSLDGQYAFITSREFGVAALDVSNLSEPRYVGGYPVAFRQDIGIITTGVHAANGLVYVPTGTDFEIFRFESGE